MAEMRNLLNDPWPNSVVKWASDSPSDLLLRMTDNGQRIYMETTVANRDLYIRTLTANLTGRFVFAVNFAEFGGGASSALMIFERNTWSRLAFKQVSQVGMAAVSFTANNQPIQLRIQCGSLVGQKVIIDHLLLMTQEDWTHMRNLKNSDGTPANIRWFAPPKTAAAGVITTPALDRGGALLVLLAIIHTLMWRWQHEPQIHYQWAGSDRLHELRVYAVPESARERSEKSASQIGFDGTGDRGSNEPVSQSGHGQHGHAVALLSSWSPTEWPGSGDRSSTSQERMPYRPPSQMGHRLGRDSRKLFERLIYDTPVSAHAHQRDGRDYAIRASIGHGLEPLVSSLTVTSRWEVTA